ncbi:MAG: GDSL family lipase, partial [Planctomycetia bacterium]|nr:GDSL family lipase [Planctomycetia bacterium]
MMKHFLLTTLFGTVFVMASGLFFPQSTLTQARAQNVQVAELPRTLVPVPKFHQSWWKERYEANCTRIAQRNVDFLFIGDSITHAWEEDAKDVWDFFYGNLNYVNMGFRGDRTQHILWRLENMPMAKIQPKAAMLLMGINNLR